MAVIKQDDLIQSVADALQFISYYHPVDFIQAMHEAYLREESPAARDSMAQILINSRMCATGHRPICQDTGIVTVFVRVGMDVRWDGATMSVDDMINEGVRAPTTCRRTSCAPRSWPTRPRAEEHQGQHAGGDPLLHRSRRQGRGRCRGQGRRLGEQVEDGHAQPVRLDRRLGAEDRTDHGRGWCPPGMLGIGIGGTAEKAAVMAKEVLMDPIDIHELKARGPQNRIEELRLELFEKVNQLGIGAQGLGGLTTVLDVKIMDYPTHAASLPVCMIPNCAATRHAHFVLDGSGPAELEAPSLDAYPEIVWEAGPSARRVDLDKITPEEVQSWKPGETLLLNGKMLTGRDAAHKRMVDMLNKGETLPVDLKGRFIYYVGPVDPVGDEVVGPAGPTTATRMDKFTRQILEQTGLLGMIGKSERGPIAIEAIKDNKAVYLMAVGGAAYLVAQAIKKSKVLAFAELGMEAIYEFEVKDMPVTVAVDTNGESVHITGPAVWQKKIAESLAIEVK